MHLGIGRSGIVVALAGAALLGGALRAQAPASTAEGTLKINGKEIALRHAYAVQEVPELEFGSAPKGSFDLIVTEKPMVNGELDSRLLLIHRMRQGGLHGVILSIDPVKKQPYSGNLLAGKRSIFFSTLDSDSKHVLESPNITAASIGGKIRMPQEQNVDLLDEEPLRYQYEATVNAAIRRPSPVTKTLTGKAAQQSPQAASLIAFMKATRTGNVAALRSHGVAAQMAMLDTPDGKELLKSMQQSMPDPAKTRGTKVMLRGNMSVLVGKAGGEEMVMKLFLEGGKWKVGLN